MRAEPEEVYLNTCDCCGEEKTQFESCNSFLCDCGIILYTFEELRNHQLFFKKHTQRRYKLCIDCGSKEVK